MSFAPPPGPPPPSVPEGWKPQYDGRYKEWYFVNLHTGKSQWERPEVPAGKEEQLHSPPDEPPPSYEDSGDHSSALGDQKLSSNNPYNARGSHTPSNDDTVESDARLAARLQAEENARSTGSHAEQQQQPGAATEYYRDNTGGSPAAAQQSSLAPEAAERGGRGRSRSFLSKLMGKASGGSSSSSGGGGYSGGYGGGYSGGYSRPPPGPPIHSSYGYPPGGGGFYGGYPAQPQMGYGYSPMGMGMGGGGYGGGYPPRRQGGMGNAGAAALGVGGGLLGGALLADAFDDHGDTYINNDYGDGGGDGGDYGGGDDGGGGDF